MFTNSTFKLLKVRFRLFINRFQKQRGGISYAAVLCVSLLFFAATPSKAWHCPIVSNSSSIKTQKPEKVKTINLTHLATQKEYADLLIQFRKVGINVTNNSKIKKKLNWLKELKFQLMHPGGMNFKLKITGFRKIEFRFVFNNQGAFQYFTYRINDDEVYQQIPTDTKGFKSYVCFDTGIVQRGETNKDIERYN